MSETKKRPSWSRIEIAAAAYIDARLGQAVAEEGMDGVVYAPKRDWIVSAAVEVLDTFHELREAVEAASWCGECHDVECLRPSSRYAVADGAGRHE